MKWFTLGLFTVKDFACVRAIRLARGCEDFVFFYIEFLVHPSPSAQLITPPDLHEFLVHFSHSAY